MRKYDIGEIISNFKEKNHVAIAFKGEAKGAIVYIGSSNKYRIRYPHGLETNNFTFALIPETEDKDSAKEWVFIHELTNGELDEMFDDNLLEALMKFVTSGGRMDV